MFGLKSASTASRRHSVYTVQAGGEELLALFTCNCEAASPASGPRFARLTAPRAAVDKALHSPHLTSSPVSSQTWQ